MKRTARPALACLLAAAMLACAWMPASAVKVISNPDRTGPDCVDGLDPDPAVGIHNSYAWCAEVFAQEGADYLWVGMNRDMAQSVLAVSGNAQADSFAELMGIPPKSPDAAGKIYRQKCDGDYGAWELMYDNPAISGYRRMILFGGDLYVCAGLTNYPAYNYSVILRFKPDFAPGDEPDIVLWEYDLCQLPNFQIIASETAHVLHYDGRYHVLLDQIKHRLEPVTVEGRARNAVIKKHGDIPKAVLFGVIHKHRPLIGNAVGFAILLVLTG
jgi:hypothetical protein